MKKEDIQVDLPENKEDREVAEIESKHEERIARKREQVEQLFVKHYDVEEGSDALKKLVDREMASGKSFDKLIKQKKRWRTEALQKKDGKVENDKDDDAKKGEKTPKNSFEKLRDVEYVKARKDFLQGLIDNHPDKFKTSEDVKEAYEKIEKEYKESGDETRREDFAKNFEKAFKLSHPDIYEDSIREKTRKELLEDDIDLSNVTSKTEGQKQKKGERKFFPKKQEPKDWLLGKK